MKVHQRFYGGWILLILLIGCQQPSQEPLPAKPNILFIAVDDLRPELNCYGAQHIHSPFIDKLAAESLVFDRAYCNIPVCGASRASLLSGVRPGRYRFLSYLTRVSEEYPGIASLPMHFKNHGYTTISNGKIYHHADDDTLAWDEVWRPKAQHSWRDYLLPENIAMDTANRSRGFPYENAMVHDSAYLDGKTALKAISDLQRLKEGDNPFFLAVGFLKPHLPFNAPSKYWDLYDSTQISLPSNYQRPASTPDRAFHESGELRAYGGVPEKGPVSAAMANKLIHGYYACVSYTDAQIGKILEELEVLGLAENTIVVLWGDHGWNLGDHMMWCKHCNFESSLHVPLIVKVPGKTSGQRSNNITEFIDIYPSLCELADLPLPDHLDGESFVPDLEGVKRSDDFAISKWYDGVTIIQDDYFYTEFLGEDHQAEESMLFDHSSDPLELNNLSGKEAYQQTMEKLHTKMTDNWGEDFFVDRKVVQED
jgi:arylsulfatase A-like enzyme